ncbi:DUF2849 domain-containing protein [Hyphococcus flavus]|uniref:DUF2849 domain-containing protein n=1 Tax=Hyphococcus flavus TaxID=1866326 RepID=A0AAE9ZDT0_9PROT|nr:DUF2849 domain-containing protein [Hyphococcus flavus]WDI33174.1 DUF2849 domain-containing protein [Hyphococcus flavus]
MKIITANRLEDGAVVYLGDDDRWTLMQSAAAKFFDADINPVLAAVQLRVKEITDAYLVDVDDNGGLAGRETLRESIRRKGPTVREDLGRTEV